MNSPNDQSHALVRGFSSRLWLLIALVLGLVIRLYFVWAKAGMYFPDEMFQYLEPGYQRMHGFGTLFWEFEDGVRNWLLPGYYAALMEVGEAFGLHGWRLHRFLAVHNAIASLLLVPLGFKLGSALGRGDHSLGVLLGLSLACFPLFAYFAPHTLSEVPASLFVCWGYACWAKGSNRTEQDKWHVDWFWAGLLLGIAVVARYSLLVLLPVVFLDAVLSRKGRGLILVSAGFGSTMLLLGLLDAVTWGRPFHSLMAYFEFHLAGGGQIHGTSPWAFYWTDGIVKMLGPAAALVVLPLFAVPKRHWRITASWLVPIALLSYFAHKEERFLLPMWPLVLCATLVGMRRIGSAFGPRLLGSEKARSVAFGIVLGTVLVSSLSAVMKLPMRNSAGVFAAQDFVGRQSDASGVLFDAVSYYSSSGESWLDGDFRPSYHGGYVLLDRGIPLVYLENTVLQHRLFNYLIIGYLPLQAFLEAHPSFVRVAYFEQSVAVYRRVEGEGSGL